MITPKDAIKKINIIVLGESTSYIGGKYSYPNILQSQLNDAYPNIFRIINLSVPAITTTQFKYSIDNYIRLYKPQLALLMIGINDQTHLSKLNMEDESFEDINGFYFEFKLLKLVKNIYLMKGKRLFKQDMKHSIIQGIDELKSQKEFTIFDKRSISKSYQLQDYNEVLKVYNKYEIKELNARAFEMYFDSLLQTHSLKEIIRKLKLHTEFNLSIGTIFRLIHMSEGVAYKNHNTVISLLNIMHEKTSNKEILNEALRYILEGYLFYTEQEFKIDDLKKSNKTKLIINGISSLEDKNKISMTIDYIDSMRILDVTKAKDLLHQIKFNKNTFGLFNMDRSIQNYRYILHSLETSQVKSILIQYPLRDSNILYNLFGKDKNVISNKENFIYALKNYHYDELFIDRFGGNFGHFTKKSATMVSSSVFTQIEKMYLQRELFH
jgi:hypothetical protein